MAVWRLQVNTGGTNVADYCLKNHVAAMGWSLRELTQAERSGIHTFLDYCNLARTQYKSFDSVCRMVEDVKEGDLLWMRSRNEGKYYIARVKANSTWVFREDAVQMDAANQLTNIDWYPATDKADEESVPGAVATSFIMGSTIQRIKKNGVEEYSQMLYNRVHDSALDLFNYPDPALSLCEKHFYSLLQPEDVEDLLALWLYDTKGYVCIPSTNKIATPKYECVLVDPNDLNRKHIYIQVKKGDVDLNTDDYSGLNGEVYLLTTEGNVQNAQKYSNVKVADPTVIYEFAINPDKSHIIPENVLYWVKFLTEIENNRLKFSACKGIMFDTNISYSDTNESEMILGNKIAAYGDAKRYIDSFRKDDYALFYSKGRGIIAVGQIVTDTPTEVGDEKYHSVRMIVPENFNGDVKALHCPYEPQKAKLVVREMTDLLVLDLVDKGLVTDQMVLTVGYDIENLTDPARRAKYHGAVETDHYGRQIPKQAHGSINLDGHTSSTRKIMCAVSELFDRIVDKNLLVRRMYVVANHVLPEADVPKKNDGAVQLDLFTDYAAEEEKQKAVNAALERERKIQAATLAIKKKYGKNAILKAMNLEEGATAKDRNAQIGGHKA